MYPHQQMYSMYICCAASPSQFPIDPAHSLSSLVLQGGLTGGTSKRSEDIVQCKLVGELVLVGSHRSQVAVLRPLKLTKHVRLAPLQAGHVGDLGAGVKVVSPANAVPAGAQRAVRDDSEVPGEHGGAVLGEAVLVVV